MTIRLRVLGVSGGTLLLAIALAAQTPDEFRVDASSSTVLVHVGRAGLFSFAGHDHEVAAPAVEGRVVIDRADLTRSSVRLRFDAGALKVTGRGEPAQDVPEVQRVMLSDRVLDVGRYPAIQFESTAVSLASPSGDAMTVRVEGQLMLHGTTRRVTVPVRVQLAPTRVTADGKFTIRQTDFGIRPVTAAGGTVRVKDELEIAFTLVATR